MLKTKYLLPSILILLFIFALTGNCWIGGYDQRIKLTIDHTKINDTLVDFPVTAFFTDAQAEEIFVEFDADEDFDRGQFILDSDVDFFGFYDKLSPNYPNDFDVYSYGNRTIIAEWLEHKISLYDSTDKSDLTLLDDIAIGRPHDVRVIDGDNDYAYYVSYIIGDLSNNKFGILNLTNESAIAIEDEITLADAWYCRAYDISGDSIVFVITHDATGGLYIYDVTDHTIDLLDSITGSGDDYNIGTAWRVMYHPGYELLIVGAGVGDGCVSVFDVSDLTDIIPTAKYEGADWKWINLFIEGNKVYGTVSHLDKIEVATINANGTLSELGDYTSGDYLDNAHGIYVEDNIIYAVSWFNDGISILDATNPTDITYVTGIYDPSLMNERHAVEKFGDYIWTAGATTYFTVHSYGSNKLFAEKELFDDSGQEAIYHFLVPSVASGEATDIYFYYDNDADHNTSYIGVIGSNTAEKVWENHKIVYHMPDLTTSTVEDSTSNSNDGTKASANNPVEAIGKVGQGQTYDANSDRIYSGASLAAMSNFTLEALVKFSSADGGTGDMIFCIPTNDPSVFRYTDESIHVYADGAEKIVSTTTIDDTDWHYVVIVADGTYIRLYIDGVEDASSPVAYTGNSANAAFNIGDNSGGTDTFTGTTDEVRAINTDRSAAWIKGDYNSLFDTLFTYGSEEEVPEVVTNVMFMFGNY